MAGEVVDITIIEENEEVVLNVLTSWVVRAAAIWFQNENPVLRKGQIGIETDTQKMKLGDGATEWNSLAYLVVTASQISALINAGPRVQTITTASTITTNADLYDEIVVSALASNAAIAAPTGSPTTRKKILYHIRDNGTPWTLTLNAIFRDFTSSFPSTTTAGKWLVFGAEWNIEDAKWDIIAVGTQP